MIPIVKYFCCLRSVVNFNNFSGITLNIMHERHTVKATIILSFVRSISLLMFLEEFAAFILAYPHTITVGHATYVCDNSFIGRPVALPIPSIGGCYFHCIHRIVRQYVNFGTVNVIRQFVDLFFFYTCPYRVRNI